MTLQQTKQKQKGKKSYSELLEEFGNAKKRIAVVYVPLLCEAMKEENPEIDYMDIKDKVVSDAVEQGWNEPYIVRCLPSWIQDADPDKDRNHINALKAHESRNKNKLKEGQLKVSLLNQTPLVEPPEPKRSYEGEDLDLEGGTRFTALGEKGKTASYMKGNITYHSARLFEALTEIDHLPYKDEDLTVEYIKPTRDYRKNLILELDEQSRKTVWNSLGAVEAAIQDMLDLLQEEMKNE